MGYSLLSHFDAADVTCPPILGKHIPLCSDQANTLMVNLLLTAADDASRMATDTARRRSPSRRIRYASASPFYWRDKVTVANAGGGSGALPLCIYNRRHVWFICSCGWQAVNAP